MESNNKSNNNKSDNKINKPGIDKVMKRGMAEINIKMFIFAFLALILACIIPYIVKILDIIILIIIGINSTEKRGSYSFEEILSQDFRQPMNLAYIMVATYALYIIIYGIWYSRFVSQNLNNEQTNNVEQAGNIKQTSNAEQAGNIKQTSNLEQTGNIIKQAGNLEQTIKKLKEMFKGPIAYLLIVGGFAGQVMVDSVLNLCRDSFPDAFREYDALVSDTVGATSSVAMLIAVFVLAPIGEELLFRGLIQGFLRRAVNDSPIAVVIIAQGLCFGVYHGNVIQCIYATILGSLLGLIAYKAGSLVPCIIFHMSLNISVCFVSEAWFEYTNRCIIAGIVSAVLFIATMLLVCKLFHKGQSDMTEA